MNERKIIVPKSLDSNEEYRIYKYATGEAVPEGSIYVETVLNGLLQKDSGYKYVWHYFLVKCKKEVNEK